MSKFFRSFPIRPQTSLPFYCDPVKLFVAIWLVMLASMQFEISYVSYPHFSLAVILFLFSFLSFILGHYFVRLICKVNELPQENSRNEINIRKLRLFNFYLFGSSVILTLYNVMVAGLPPVFAFLGFDTKPYFDYGRLKQVIFPLLMALFVNSFLESSTIRKLFYSTFAFLAMLSYVARGSMLLMLLQALIVFSIRTSKGKARLYLIAGVGLIGAAFLADFIGSNRTGDAIFFAYMQIKTQYQQWPTIYLWVISYVSTPLSNLCWLVDLAHFDHVTWSFAYPLLPSFWLPSNPHLEFIENSKIIDGVHTYLATYFLDLSYFGIASINCFVGMISGYYSSDRRISRYYLTSSIFLTCIAFMFFFDFFAYLETVVQFAIQAVAQYYFMKEYRPLATGVTKGLGIVANS
jgi:oligosaccharide repeat unit polymerase